MEIINKLSALATRVRRFIFIKMGDLCMEEQPTDSTCGQTCIAYIVGVSVDDVISVIGKKKGTYGTDLKKALKVYNVPHSDKMIRISKKTIKPDHCIVGMQNNLKREGHWVIFRKGKYYDPGNGTILSQQEFRDGYIDWRETSYIEIFEAF